MPRDGSGVASKPAGTTASPNTTIESAKFNSVVDDIYALLNAALPVTAGGTGETTARLKDGTWRFQNTADTTKLLAFDLSGLTTATTRTVTLPDKSGTLAMTSDISADVILRGYLHGLTLSNNVTDATNDIDIAVGQAASDATTPVLMTLASALTKRLDATWAVGTNQGMLASGAAITNTTYHIFLIKRPDTGVVDIAADSSVTGANIAANTNAAYTSIRRIGSIVRAGGAIRAFWQNGDEFLWNASAEDVSSSAAAAAAATVTLTVPTGIVVRARVTAFINASGTVGLRLSSLAISDQPPSVGGYTAVALSTLSAGLAEVRTNTSGQIRRRESAPGATISIFTEGYFDTRGRI